MVKKNKDEAQPALQDTITTMDEQTPKSSDIFDLSKVDYTSTQHKMIFPSADIRNRGRIPRDSALKILEHFRKMSTCEDHNIAFRGFTLLIQEGGANRSKNKITVTVGNNTFSLEVLKIAMKQ